MLFHTRLRTKGGGTTLPTWEIAPVHAPRLCIDQDMEVTWGTRLLPRVVLNDCVDGDPNSRGSSSRFQRRALIGRLGFAGLGMLLLVGTADVARADAQERLVVSTPKAPVLREP